MSDDFLTRAQADWLGHAPDLDGVRRRLHRRRWLPHILLGLELLGAAAAFGVGLGYLRLALLTHELLFGLSAAVMLVVMPVFAVASLAARGRSLRWEAETPESVLRMGLERAKASRAAVRIGWWGSGVLAAFVAVLWMLQGVGALRAAGFLVFYTITVAAACGPYLIYLSWRRRRILAERAACERLLRELDAA